MRGCLVVGVVVSAALSGRADAAALRGAAESTNLLKSQSAPNLDGYNDSKDQYNRRLKGNHGFKLESTNPPLKNIELLFPTRAENAENPEFKSLYRLLKQVTYHHFAPGGDASLDTFIFKPPWYREIMNRAYVQKLSPDQKKELGFGRYYNQANTLAAVNRIGGNEIDKKQREIEEKRDIQERAKIQLALRGQLSNQERARLESQLMDFSIESKRHPPTQYRNYR